MSDTLEQGRLDCAEVKQVNCVAEIIERSSRN